MWPCLAWPACPQIDNRHILSTADCSFEWHVRTRTRGRGVDVVLSALPGEQFKASMRCLAHWGRLLHHGREDMVAATAFGEDHKPASGEGRRYNSAFEKCVKLIREICSVHLCGPLPTLPDPHIPCHQDRMYVIQD